MQDINKFVVFGSQFVGVLIVIVTLVTQQPPLRSPRPRGMQISADSDKEGDRFARLWDDPLKEIPPVQSTASPFATATPSATGTGSATATPSAYPSPSVTSTPSTTGTVSAKATPTATAIAFATDTPSAANTTLPSEGLAPTARRKLAPNGDPGTAASTPVTTPENSPDSANPTPSSSPASAATPEVTQSPVEAASFPTATPSQGVAVSVTAQSTGGPENLASASSTPTPTATSFSTYRYKFLWNIVDGRNIPDETEHRLRIRYALVSAVEALGYLPFRESALKQVAVEIQDTNNQASASPNSNKTASASKIRKIGCFETFIRQPDSQSGLPDRVCLIWEPKDIYDDNFKIINDIVNQTIENISIADEAATPVTPDLHFLHHGTSDALSAYLKEPDHIPSYPTSFTYATMPIPTPTPDKFATGPIPRPTGTPDCLERPIVTDDKLIKALVEELKLRIPQLSVPNGPEGPRIVIFTESNTKYSREIVKELENALPPGRRPEVYTYLSGLDGLSDEFRSTVASNKANPSLDTSGTPSSETFGTSQFDYLRRTARMLRGKTSRNSPEHIVAVGILGTDIYDKMVVLQAIRGELPSAIFFTTDLDALYLSTEMTSVTRNVVIASGDDLDVETTENIETSEVTKCSPAAAASPTASPEYPGRWKLPPMRDSYQSMLVREVQRILASKDSDNNPPEKLARAYEIASGKDVLLNTDRGCWSECLLWILAHWQINPIVFLVGLINAFAILGAIFAVFDKLYLYCPFAAIRRAYRWCRAQSGVPPVVVTSELRLRRVRKERTLISDCSIILLAAELTGALFFVVIILVKLFSAQKHRFLFEEPMDLGISIWPSILIRLFAFIAAILLLIVAMHSFVSWRTTSVRQLLPAALFRRSRDESGNAISSVARGRVRRSDARRLLRIVVARPSFRLRLLKTLLRRSDSGKALKKALDHSITRLISPKRRFWRIVRDSILYLLFSLVLFTIWQPTTPGRGGGALFIEKVVLAFGVGLYVIHLIFCIDLHWSAYKLLYTIRKCLLLLEDPRRSKNVPQIDLPVLSETLAGLTNVIGRTLLYPLTVLILIILSRLPIFDNWRMTTSLFVTFALGAFLLVVASLLLWYEGAQFKKALVQLNKSRSNLPRYFRWNLQTVGQVQAVTTGAFGAWYSQPIVAAILSAATVFGSVSIADPIVRLLLR